MLSLFDRSDPSEQLGSECSVESLIFDESECSLHGECSAGWICALIKETTLPAVGALGSVSSELDMFQLVVKVE